MSPKTLIEPRWAAVTAVLAAIIVWGSLYPFVFLHRGPLSAGLRYLVSTWRTPDGRGDLISNILLYSPLGFFAARTLRRPGFAARVILITLCGTLLSGAMELTQFWDLTRDPSVADLYSNATGTLLGALASGLNPRAWNFPLLGKIEWRPYAILLLLFWLGNRMFPYVPAFAWPEFHQSWKPLLSAPALLDLYRYTVDWLAVALLLEALFGVERSRLATALLIGCVTFWRLLIGVAGPAEEYGALLALALWTVLVARSRQRARFLAVLFALSVLLQSASPFHFLAHPRSFRWIPFVSFINGPRANGVRVFFDKSFTYGVFVWLAARSGLSWIPATILCASFVLALRLAQVYLPGRSAEVTDAAMVVILACIMKLMRDVPAD